MRLYACIISPDIKRDRGLLVGVADRFASVIEVIEDGVLFDVSGLERLVGKPDRIAQKIIGELKRKNVAGKVAVADTLDTAKLLARCTSPAVREGKVSDVSPSLTAGPPAQPDMFEQLPLSGLDIEPGTLKVFNELGFRTVKDLLAVPPDELVSRYGQQFTHVIDVIEQRGRSLITPNIKENKVSWSFELNSPVENFEQLIFLLNHGLDRLFAEVKYAGFSTEHLDLDLKLKNKTTKSYEIKTSFPTLDRSFWLKLINLRAALDPPEELITAVDAVAHFTKPRTDQRGLYAVSRPEPESLLLTVGKLKKLVGEDNVGVPVLVNQRLAHPFVLDPNSTPVVTGKITQQNPFRPNRSIYIEDPLADDLVHPMPASAENGIKAPHLSLVTKQPQSPFADISSGPKSIIGFDHFIPPVSAEVLARDGRLVYIRTRLFAGHMTNFSGVWKANSYWWAGPWKTQEWDIEIENGGVYRLCKANDEWFLTGEYD